MNKFGFLLIVLALLVLVGAGLYIINPYKTLAMKNDQQRVQDLNTIAKAIESYYRDYGHYPTFNSDYEIVTGEELHRWGFQWTPYIEKLPKDPSPFKRYIYWADENNGYQSYRLYTSLEMPQEVEHACEGGKECVGVPGENLCGGRPCNFGVTSSNISP